MPQDTVWTDNNGSFIVYPPGWDTVSPEIKHFFDSVTSATIVPERSAFDKKSESYSALALPLTILLFAGTWMLVKYFSTNPLHLKLDDDDPPVNYEDVNTPADPCLVYDGAKLNLPEDIVIDILQKRFPYFNKLGIGEQKHFLIRHKKFMSGKTFNIHEATGFREMPVLISAAAIQLSFGLEEYRLPDYPYIHIYPREFIRTQPVICFLEGNVSGNCINISRKHFLDGYENAVNGENVGLHEMAHAYYCQNFLYGNNIDACFVKGYPDFTSCGTAVFNTASTVFYSSYAFTNMQEFWAETVERYFESPAQMKNNYPGLYAAMGRLLNQDPLLLMG